VYDNLHLYMYLVMVRYGVCVRVCVYIMVFFGGVFVV